MKYRNALVFLSACAFVGPALSTPCIAQPATAVTTSTNASLSDTTHEYVEQLVQRAVAQELHVSRAWLRLGHWRSGFFGGWSSEVDGSTFFLANEGKEDPRAELEATIRGFFEPAPPPIATKPGEPPVASPHPMCRFPARFMWLSTALQIDPQHLPSPAPACARLLDYWTRTSPKGVSLIFSSYYLNNPSSAFGHTFLRIHKHRDRKESERQSLLDSGVDYGAVATTDNAFLYGFMGMTGLFEGRFSRKPYFYKVREYNDYESRDIWEYELDVSPQVIIMLVGHIWELGGTYFDYFYLTENCSYQVLGALEAADPSLNLLSELRTIVLPVDALQAVTRSPGLVKSVHFRPSLQTRFEARAKTLSPAQRDQLYAIAETPSAPMPEHFESEEKIAVLDGAADYIDLTYAEDILRDGDSEGARLKQAILERRAEIRRPSPDFSVPTPEQSAPHLTHDSSRVGLGAGALSSGEPFMLLDWRAHLHDLADPTPGLPELSQLEFLPLRLRLEPEARKVRLERLDLVHVGILSPIRQFASAPSWDFRVGLQRLQDPGCTDCLAGRVAFGAGGAVAFFDEALSFYLLTDIHVQYHPDLAGLRDAPVRLGIGPNVGMRLRFTPRLITHVNGSWVWYPWAEPKADWWVNATARWAFSQSFAIGIEARAGERVNEASALLFAYY